jgi:hypothetical protein
MLARLLGRKPSYWWTWETGGVLAEVTPDELARFEAARAERRVYWHGSITRARLTSKPAPCMKF